MTGRARSGNARERNSEGAGPPLSLIRCGSGRRPRNAAKRRTHPLKPARDALTVPRRARYRGRRPLPPRPLLPAGESYPTPLRYHVEAFVSRFGRLQDTIADKLLPTDLRAAGETPGLAVDTLDRGEGAAPTRFDPATRCDQTCGRRALAPNSPAGVTRHLAAGIRHDAKAHCGPGRGVVDPPLAHRGALS